MSIHIQTIVSEREWRSKFRVQVVRGWNLKFFGVDVSGVGDSTNGIGAISTLSKTLSVIFIVDPLSGAGEHAH
jgi:hypothetical protein